MCQKREEIDLRIFRNVFHAQLWYQYCVCTEVDNGRIELGKAPPHQNICYELSCSVITQEAISDTHSGLVCGLIDWSVGVDSPAHFVHVNGWLRVNSLA